ncbi:MAG: flagellar hook-basal body complex protein, partial [Desulfohalobiaceae bacterium]
MSGLSSSMYSGTSGLNAHGEKMSNIGDNLSNVSTVGFKKSTMHFEDFMPQDINTSAGVGQVGRGVSVGAVMQDFQQGSLETTNESTDVAIGGNGFFVVSPQGEEQELYTRAGNFRFDEDGYLVDPHDNVVQGWDTRKREVEQAEGSGVTAGEETGVEIQGVPEDIRLENFQSSPEATSNATMGLNLDSRSTSNADDLKAAWDATNDDEPPLGQARYEYQNTMNVYDANGTSHEMTTYFDKIDPTGTP